MWSNRAWLIIILLSLLASSTITPCLAAGSPGPIIHEDPSDVKSISGPNIDSQMQALLQLMIVDSADIASYLNASDFAAANLSYWDFHVSYDSYRQLMEHFNLSQSDYNLLVANIDALDLDISTMVNDSVNYNATYQAYRQFMAEGDRANATESALKLKGYYDSINQSHASLFNNITLVQNKLSGTGVDASLLDSSLKRLDDYMTRLDVEQRDVEQLLSDSNLTLVSDVDQAAVGSTITFTASLNKKDGSPIGNGPVLLHVSGRTSGSGVTDGNGETRIKYVVPQDAPGRLTAYATFEPSDKSQLPTISDIVEISVPAENTSISSSVSPGTASFGDTVTVSGALLSEKGIVLHGRTIDIYLGGVRAGTATTGEDGTYVYNLTITGSSPGGNTSVMASFTPDYNGVFAGSTSESQLNIIPVGTSLSLSSSGTQFTGGDAATFSGILRADNGRPVSDADVAVYAGDRRLGTARTGNDGGYRLTVAIPYDLQPGDTRVMAEYASSGGALAGVKSNVVDVTFVQSPPVISVSSPASIVFAGDVVEVNGSVKLADGRPVSGQPLLVSLADRGIGSPITGLNGSFSFSRGITGNDSPGMQPLIVSTTGDGLISKSTVQAGQVLIVPYDKASLLALALLSLAIVLLVIARLTGFDRRIMGGLRNLLARRTEEAAPISPQVPPAEAVPEVAPFVIEDEIASLSKAAASGDMARAVTGIYMLSRHIANLRGIAVPDSATHLEFYGIVIGRQPALQASLKPIIDLYEAEAFGRRVISGRDAEAAMACLRDFHLKLAELQESAGQ
ncbi:DUF4129 domain-containing protein [Methanocella arvoryzae]|uniref:Protein-glutamine gamma-glutamyltransferase-like C-terminal domain-containing protein n=1 Tax=Methanocella arvoryzae (strain DSM 22066 / NBRC 105507 / MRE50) TaxID=351160 RepID=Q0W4E3_METAR|nr:DUF4129 domain-containing protein [Methanocella arvoryzae]CAJ36750.1 hypothetical protein RCIX1483 [Methanocella arvoryzae MRE50]